MLCKLVLSFLIAHIVLGLLCSGQAFLSFPSRGDYRPTPPSPAEQSMEQGFTDYCIKSW